MDGETFQGFHYIFLSANKRIFHRAFQLFCFLLICSSLGEQFSAVKRKQQLQSQHLRVCLKCVALGKVLHILNLVSQWLSDVNSPVNSGSARVADSISVLERSPGGRNGNTRQYSAWKIQQAVEIGGLQSIGQKESDILTSQMGDK